MLVYSIEGMMFMDFWTVVLVIGILAIVSEFVVRIVKIGTKYSENIERVKHGYPTLNGDVPLKSAEPAESEADKDFRGTSLYPN